MKIIRLKKEEDLEMVKSLVDYKEYFESDDIMWDWSVKCIASNGDLLGFALVKPNSLIDFFKGELPPDNSVKESRKWRKKMRIEYYNGKHYEVVFFIKSIGDKYLESDGLSDLYLQYLISHEIELSDDEDGDLIDGLFWSRHKVPDYVTNFNSYNDVVYVDILPID